MSYLLTQALALLEEAASYTSCETWSPSLTDEINSFVVNARAALAANVPTPEESSVDAEPFGWITMWAKPGGGHEPVLSIGEAKPNYGEKLNALLTIFPIYREAAAPAQTQQAGWLKADIIRAAVAAMPHTNPGVADDLLHGDTMHTEADDVVAIFCAGMRATKADAKPLTDEQIVALFDANKAALLAIPGGAAQVPAYRLHLVRMVERAHGIGASSEERGNG